MTKIVGDVHAIMRFSFDSRVGSAVLAGKARKARKGLKESWQEAEGDEH
jgi:hypothetical protein